MKLELVVVPVVDADLAKQFYASFDWRLDADAGHKARTGTGRELRS